MIEIKSDSAFASPPDPLFPDRVRIVGLGQTGVAVCDQLVLHGGGLLELVALDTDQQIIESSVVPERHLLGRTLARGLGCSGDLDLAREIVALEEHRLAPLARECDYLILVLGLAGATALALAEHFVAAGHRLQIPVLVIAVQPFACEGLARRERALHTMGELRREADCVLVFAHDRLAEHPVALKNIRHGFHLMHRLLAHTAQALAQVLCKRGLIQLSFADLRSLYGRFSGAEALENSWIARTEADLDDPLDEVIDHLFAGELLADEGLWKHVDHALVTIGGTRHLGFADVQELLRTIKHRLPANVTLSASATLEQESGTGYHVTLLLARTAPPSGEAEPIAPPRPKRKPKFADTALLPPAALPTLEPPMDADTKFEAPPAPITLPPPKIVRRNGTLSEKAKPAPTVEPLSPAPAQKPPLASAPALAVAPDETGPLPEARPIRPQNSRQEEMQFESPKPGRFEKAYETIYRGENLDQPTFRRRAIKIRT